MISRPRLIDALKRAAGLDWSHLTMAVGAAVAVALTVSSGLAVARAGPAERAETARRIARLTGGDVSEAGFLRLAAEADPAVIALAKRFEGVRPAEAQTLLFRPVDENEARRINDAIPFAADAIAAAAPFHLNARSPAERAQAVRCLANAVYYEAALEPTEGQEAVAQVVVNRVRDPNFPNSVCGVVYQGWERYTGCQFSFTCDGALVRKPIPVLWDRARKVAEAALAGHVQTAVGAATHYHADYVAPYWAPGLVKITQIGAHIFYRWPGAAGEASALTAAYGGGELRFSEAVLSGRAARPGLPPTTTAVQAMGATTVEMTDPATGESRTRVQATLTPEVWGRRKATPEEIAHINALLEAKYPTKTAEVSAAESEASPVS